MRSKKSDNLRYAASISIMVPILLSLMTVTNLSYADDLEEKMQVLPERSTEGSIEVSVRISESSDDAEEAISTGGVRLKSTDLELVDEGAKNQLVGMRFPGVRLPQGASIISAHIYFTVDDEDSIKTNLTFHAESKDDAPSFTHNVNDISKRAKTTASVDWNNVPVWDTIRARVSSPDLSPIIQEVVNRSGWSSGNSIVILVTGSGERTAESYDGDPAGAPLLLVKYAVSISPTYADAKPTKSEDEKQIFGCGIYGTLVHCDPMVNKLRNYYISGTGKMIYDPPTKSPQAIFVDGMYGRGLQFEDGDYVSISNEPALNPTQFSIAFWLQKIAEPPDNARIVGNLELAENGFITRFDDDTGVVFLSIYNTSGERTRTISLQENLPIGMWRHYSWTFDGKTVTVYEDGVSRGTIPFSGTYAAISSRKTFHFVQNGQANIILDEVQIFNRALAENEIMKIFDQPSKVSNGMVGYWPLDGHLNDISENDNDGDMRTAKSKTYIPSMAFAPDGRLFFTEKTNGVVRIMEGDNVLATPFVKISNVHDTGENGMLGITVDPDFTENHFVYLYYTHLDSKASQPYNRLLRYTDNNGIGADMKVLLDKIPASPRGFHSGGALAFGPDDKLYITVGDSAIKKYAQDVSSPNGKVLRINRDGSFPDDNPFPNSPVYTFGHRNMFGIAFNKSEKFGIVTENGHSHYDEVNMIEKGGNYGYPLQQPQDLNPALSNSSIKPVRSYWKNIAPAQAIYYDGEKFPELKNKFLLASFLSGNIHALQFDEDAKEIIQEEVIRLNHDRPTISLAQSEDGSIYYGGKKMYVLETIDSTDKEEILYHLEITGAVDIKDLQLDKDERTMVIDMYSQESPSIVTIKIPKVVLDGVKFAFAVNEDGEETLINTEVDSSSLDHNVVDVNIPSNVSQLVIFGTSVIPEFPIFGIILILSLIFMIVTFLAKGKELVRLTIQ